MKIALIGASGFVGSAILKEALDRGHEVTAIARNPEKLNTIDDEKLTLKQADIMNTGTLAGILQEHDAVISAYNPGWTNPELYSDFIKGSQSIQEAVKNSGVKRLIVVGGAGSLFVAPGVQLLDTPHFPEDYRTGASAARDYLTIIKDEEELEWTFLSPAIEMHPGTSGERKGTYRTGQENPVFDENNRSIISVEDMALAILDETEAPKQVRRRFTVAY
ncbi:NAD(P)-dependent oxidoreductase [Flavihumibacter sp. R14]|nr:NAD(P)-dependent oxidoreductase [Flavihumibacter soli]